MSTSRRRFIKMGSLAGSGLLLPGVDVMANTINAAATVNNDNLYAGDELSRVSFELLKKWGAGLLALQVHRPGAKTLHGGFLCPACATIHGRSGDAVFPLLFLADKTGDKRYFQAALDVYEWMENTVSCPDGAWINEINVSAWKGTTVFATIALGESIDHFSHLIGSATKTRWLNRLRKAADYLYNTFTIKTGNINYPISGSYALALTGKLLNEQKYTDRGRELAHQSLPYITKDNLLYGEGHAATEPSVKGCYSVDLGYNVEESLPSLVMYAKLTNDTEVLEAVTRALKAHAEFMLPDGAWDNSWGTRNFKWTWWGSRTSDGCQPAYGLMADKDPAFYTVALKNTLLFDACTHNNLLHGGPHYASHQVQPCVHHTFSHSKALTSLLIKKGTVPSNTTALLPRQQAYGVKTFADISTWLIAKGNWRGTVTGYDQEYSMHAGHTTGGALSLLWHNKAGAVIVASMNRYQMTESFNQQRDDDPKSMCLTPRLEAVIDGTVYTTINDLKATVDYQQSGNDILFTATAALVDESQAAAPGMASKYITRYEFTDEAVIIRTSAADNNVKFILPLIAKANETVKMVSANKLQIQKPGGVVTVETNTAMHLLYGAQERIFNFVPGMEAVPVQLSNQEIEIKIYVT